MTNESLYQSSIIVKLVDLPGLLRFGYLDNPGLTLYVARLFKF